MDKQSFKSFCQSSGVTAISKVVNTNTKGYPFITILRGNVAENIYFGRKSAAKVEHGDAVKPIASDLYVSTAINAAGEARLKLSFSGESTYDSVDDMF